MAKLQWNELTAVQQTGLVLGGVLQFGLLGAALFDLSRRSPSRINGSKTMWRLVALLNFIGPAAYFTRGRKPGA